VAELPVAQALNPLKAALTASPAVILTADTGSGKTTWLPLQLLDATWLKGQKIVMLEPRRVAARAAAARLAFHLGEQVGKTVGYSVRFDSKVSSATRLEVVTEGILARRIVNDPELKGVGLVIFDEFHERHVETDLALALTLESRSVFRPDLKLMVMSATIDTAAISKFMRETLDAEAPIVTSSGTNFPVEIKYETGQLPTGLWQIAETCARKAIEAQTKHEGDVLIFLPGAGEIGAAIELLEERNLKNTDILPLYGELTAAEQDRVLASPIPGRRRIIVATPIAESSLTVEGLAVVVDSGLVRQPALDPGTGITHLETVPITQDSAVQRSGRAGRLGPGTCYRMYHEADFKRRPKTRPPEILRTDLAEASLRTLAFGSPLRELTLMDRPSEAMLSQAEKLLRDLGALGVDGKLTELGSQAAAMPLPPRLAVMLAAVPSNETVMLAALLSERDPFNLKGSEATDLASRFNLVQGLLEQNSIPFGIDKKGLQAVERVYKQLAPTIRERTGELGSALLFAYPDRICMQRDPGSFLMRGGRGVSVEKGDHNADAEFLIAVDVTGGEKNAKLRLGLAVSRNEVIAHFKNEIAEKQVIRTVSGKPRAYLGTRLDALVLSEKETALPEGYARQAIYGTLREQGIENVLGEEALQFCIRVQICRQWDASLPAFDFAELTKSAEDWLDGFITNAKSLNEVSESAFLQALAARLSYAQKKLIDEKLPERLAVPSGSSHRIHYMPEKATVSVRIQEVFGLDRHPVLVDGKLPLALELLSPGKQPIATTHDIAAFWKSTYAEVRKEMRGRYPKHFWPEDPLSMQGTTGTKKAFDRKKT
jgi:ATP-dependent helicase HrpB